MVDETIDSLAYLRSGFRAKYLVDAIEKVQNNQSKCFQSSAQ